MKRVLGIIVVIAVLASALYYWERDELKPVEKPALWGLTDPPALANMSWEKTRNAEVLKVENGSAPQLYGEVIAELQDLGYAMSSGNWSRTNCQWSLWERAGGKTYYVAYNGSTFLAVRGKSSGVLNETRREWLCGKPSGLFIASAPSPWKAAEVLAIGLGKELMDANISIGQANWSGPLPDWYLAKFSFGAKAGDGVQVLILIYSKDDQVRYAEYVLRKADGSLRFMESDAGQYRALIVLKGRKSDVDRVLSVLVGAPKA